MTDGIKTSLAIPLDIPEEVQQEFRTEKNSEIRGLIEELYRWRMWSAGIWPYY
jgi:hypothetical protein